MNMNTVTFTNVLLIILDLLVLVGGAGAWRNRP